MYLNTPEGKLRAFEQFKRTVDLNMPEWVKTATKPIDRQLAQRFVGDTTMWHVPFEYEKQAIDYLMDSFNKLYSDN